MKPTLFFLTLCLSFHLFAQDSLPNLQLSGYLETYYTFDFARPANQTRPGFVYSHNRHNEFNLNLGLIKAAYAQARVRGNLALMAGTYPNANLAAEPGVLRNVFEANVGYKLAKNQALWLDAGIFAAHIGYESAIGRDCWTLTRSMMADNSPYYESGVKITRQTEDDKWLFSVLWLNGWQRIQRVPGNNTPAFGHQITFKPNDKITLNSSSFIGNDKSDSLRQMRYFHNLYGIFQVNEQWALTLAFDLGAEQRSKGSREMNVWYTPVLLLRFSPSEKLGLNARWEHYSDAEQVIVSTGTDNGFRTSAYSLNMDLNLSSQLMWRAEWRYFSSRDAIFGAENNLKRQNSLLSTSLCLAF
jgi:Putative beta-barrel porin-2, OmpL-like. bbp2